MPNLLASPYQLGALTAARHLGHAKIALAPPSVGGKAVATVSHTKRTAPSGVKPPKAPGVASSKVPEPEIVDPNVKAPGGTIPIATHASNTFSEASNRTPSMKLAGIAGLIAKAAPKVTAEVAKAPALVGGKKGLAVAAASTAASAAGDAAGRSL